MRPGDGDDAAHEPANRRTCRECRDDTERDGERARVDAAECVQHRSHRETRKVGGKGNGQVEAVGNNRHQHRQRQQTEFRQLESDRGEGGAAQKARRRQAEDEADEHQQGEKRSDFGIDKPGGARPHIGLNTHWAVLRLGAPRQFPMSLPTPSLERVIARRMITPMIILKA